MAKSSATTSTPLSSPNALIELEIPGRTGPVPTPPAAPGETWWGINHGAAMDNFPLHGLQVYIPRWSAMGIGDSVDVFLNTSTVVASEVIDSGEADQRVTTFVPAVRLTPGKHQLHYSVRRFGQVPDPSVPTDIYVKLDRPGGQDQDGDNPGHSELKLSLPQDIINDGVDAEAAKAGVPATISAYPNMAEADVIRLSWGGHFVHHRVTAAEVGQDIVITVDEATILAAGDSGANGLSVTFEVYDLVQNRSDGWSAEIRITVDTGNSRLPTAFVDEAENNVLDLDKLGDKDATGQVVAMSLGQSQEELTAALGKARTTRLTASMGKETLAGLLALRADFNRGDKIVLRVTGTTEEGAPVFYEAPEVVIDNLPHIYEIKIPNLILRQLAKTQAVVSYRLLRLDGSEGKSKGAFINIIGEPIRMAPPVAKDAAQGALDPALPSTRIEVPWDESMAAGDQITLKWLGTRPDFSIYDPLLPPHAITNGEAASKLPIMFTVPGTHLRAIEGGTLELYYILEKDVGGTIVARESARATRLNIGEPRAELPAPEVSDINDGIMDPALTSATLTVINYNGKEIGDEVHYLWKGSKGGETTDYVVVNSFTKPTPIVFTIDGRHIAPNDGGSVEASYWVIRVADGRRSDSDITSFDVGQPVVLDPPVLGSIKDAQQNEIPNDGTTYDTSVTVAGTAAANQQVEIFDGATSKGTATANGTGAWTLPLTGLATGTHAIKAKALYGSGAETAVRNFTVAAMVNPVLGSIKDSQQTEIPNNGTTYDTSVTVAGTAAANQQVQIFDGTTSKGTATANGTGAWTLPLTGLATGTHAIKAKALYGSGAETAVRNFTVAAMVNPTLTSIKDSQDTEIPNNGTTSDTSVTVTGKAAANQQVEILDGSTSKGIATANSAGDWTWPVLALATGAHAIKAKALYGSGTETAVRNFTVVQVTAIAITSVKDSNGNPIANGGTTTDTSVTLEGTVTFG